MTTLLIDGLIALVKAFDRAWPQERASSPAVPYPAVERDAQPAAGGDSLHGVSAATGGGRPVRPTSELLAHAVRELDYAYPAKQHAIIADLQAELRLRAAEFAAVGD